MGSLEFYRAIAEPAASITVVVGADFTIKWISPSVRYIGGYEPEELIGTNAIALVHPDDIAFAMESLDQAATREKADVAILGRPFPFRLLAKSGPIWCEIGGDIRFDDPAVEGMILRIRQAPTHVLLDRFLAGSVGQAPLREAIAPLLELFEFEVPESCATIGLDWDGERFGDVVIAELSSEDRLRVLDPTLALLRTGAARDEPAPPWQRALDDGGLVSVDVGECGPTMASAMRAADASACWCLSVTAKASAEAACLVVWRPVPGAPWTGHEVYVERTARFASLAVERHHYERRLVDAATHDPLTGLLNRRAFYDILQQFHGSTPLAVLFIDLDGFKPINDEFGHEAGDTVLRIVSERLSHAVRAGDTAARLGGDEFAVLLAPPCAHADAELVSERLVQSVTSPIDVPSGPVRVGVSVGVAVTPTGHAGDPATLLDAADAAMYRAKQAGGSRWLFA